MRNEDELIKNILDKAIESISDKKGENIISLKFSPEQSSICDYFVICEASNPKQAQAISDHLERKLRTDLQVRPTTIEGYQTATWILIDYFDVIIHIFQNESREFYSLEKLWADSEIMKYN
ncbi:MAG: ribosome silencing factor [Bacteroidales bacterium]|nr:ribosome silencing factor [Bacteroidales bacterium]